MLYRLFNCALPRCLHLQLLNNYKNVFTVLLMSHMLHNTASLKHTNKRLNDNFFFFPFTLQILLVLTTVNQTELELLPLILPYPTNHLCCLRIDGESACLQCPNQMQNKQTWKTNWSSSHTVLSLIA